METIVKIKLIQSSVGKVFMKLLCISFTIKNIGYFKSKVNDCPLEKVIFIRVTILSFSESSLFAILLILKFIIIVTHLPSFIFLSEKSNTNLLFPAHE